MTGIPRAPRPLHSRGGLDRFEREPDGDSRVVTVIDKDPQDASPSRHGCLVVLNGLDLAKGYLLREATTLIGRSSKVDIQIDEDAVSRRHAAVERRADRFVMRDLDSTNGTYVNEHAVREHTLVDGDQIKIGRTILKFLSGSNIEASYHEEVYRLTTTDGLTEVYNQRYFLKEMARELGRAMRYGRDLSLVLCDIDCFKAINDIYGHVAGDYVLKHLAQHIQRHLRGDDLFARYGGEEFVALLPSVEKGQAAVMAEALRKLVECEPFEFDDVAIPVTLSMGVADLGEYCRTTAPRGADNDPDVNCFALIKLADERLYRAKATGRNTIVAD